MDTNTASYIKAVSLLDEITTTYLSASEITAAYANKTNSLVVPNIFNDADSNLLLTEFSLTTEVGGYESKLFRFSTFAKNLYTLLSASNENFKAIKEDVGYLSSSLTSTNSRIDSLEESIANSLNGVYASITENVNALIGQINAVYDSLTANVKDLNDRITEVYNQLYYDNLIGLDGKVNEICVGLSTAIAGLANGNSDKYLRTLYVNEQTVQGPVTFNYPRINGNITNADNALTALTALTANIALSAYWS